MSSATGAPTVGPEQAAVRKVMYHLAELDGTDTDGMDLLTAANQAISNVNDLATRVEDLEAKIDVLEERAPSPGRKEYDQMDREDKATVVAHKLRDTAEGTNGRAAMKYKDIVAVFDGRPSAGHAYDIMETAGQREDINLGTTPNGEKRLTYDVND